MNAVNRWFLIAMLCSAALPAQPPGAKPSTAELEAMINQGAEQNPRLAAAKARWPEEQSRIDLAIARQEQALKEGGATLDDEIERLQLASLKRRDPTGQYLLGRLLGRAGRFDKAGDAYRRAIEYDEFHWWSWRGLGSAYAAQGSFEYAERHYRRALELKPDDVGTRENLIFSVLEFRDKGDVERAERLAAEGIAMHPTAAMLHMLHGQALMRQGRYREALPSLARARELTGEVKNLPFMMAQCQMHTGQTDEAIRTMEEDVAKNPGNARSLMFLGDLYKSTRVRQHAAANAYEQAANFLGSKHELHDKLLQEVTRLRAGPDRLPERSERQKTPQELIEIGRNSLDKDQRIEAMRLVATMDPTRWDQAFLQSFLQGLADSEGHVVIIVLDAMFRWCQSAESFGDEDSPFHRMVNQIVPLILDVQPPRKDAHLVRGKAAHVLGHHGSSTAVPKLIQALRRESDLYAFQQMHEALNRLTYAYIAVDATVDAVNFESVRSEWLTWWETQKAAFGR